MRRFIGATIRHEARCALSVAWFVTILIAAFPAFTRASEIDLFLKGRETLEKESASEQRVLDRLEAIEGPLDRATYRLGPGDRLSATLSGPVRRSEIVVVTAEGTVIVPPAAGVAVAGLTVQQAEQAIQREIQQYFRGVTAHVDLVGVRRFEVYVLGMVVRIGTYVVDGGTRVSSVVNDAGGVLNSGSLRRIRLLRADGSEPQVDLHRFLLLGDRDANPILEDGDRVVVPVAGEKAAIHGAVGRPDDYEVLPGETVADLVRLAGDTMPRADPTRVELRRFSDRDGAETRAIEIDLTANGGETPVEPGDQIFVYSRHDWHAREIVDVRGEVSYPGAYGINEGEETLRDVIQRAGGVTSRASLREATLTRTIAADTLDREYERLRQIDAADMSHDEYEYFKLKSREQPGRVVVDFEEALQGDEAEDVALRRGDRIFIPTATRMVLVEGQVATPGAIAYEDGRPIAWYIDRAGGYGWRAAKGKTRIIRATTGEWVSAKKAKTPEVGDTIWVPEKPERDWWQMFRDGLTVTGQILTVYLVIDRISE